MAAFRFISAFQETLSRLAFGRVLMAAACISLIPLAGCQRYYGPLFSPPGTVFQQRYIAVQHDPYPSDVFGPKIEGGRPLGYTKGLAEPAASQFSLRGR